MPIYAYKCDDCGYAQDVLQKVSDAPLTDCPACGKPALRKQVTAAGFQLKGSGWYVTDFRDGGKSKTATADQAGAAAPEAKSQKAEGGADAAKPAPAAAESGAKASSSTPSSTSGGDA